MSDEVMTEAGPLPAEGTPRSPLKRTSDNAGITPSPKPDSTEVTKKPKPDREAVRAAQAAAKAREREEAKRLREEEVRRKKAEKEEEVRCKKEEEHAKKEEERLRKEEEKKAKEAEKEAERKAKEVEKLKQKGEREAKQREKEEARKAKERAKEEARKQEQEAKLKKEKSQMRLNNFFAKPATPKKASPVEEKSGVPQSDFDKYFHPFFVRQYTDIAPFSAFKREGDALKAGENQIDRALARPPSEVETTPIQERLSQALHSTPSRKRRRGRKLKYTVKQLIQNLNNPDLIDSTSSSQSSPDQILAILNSPRKIPQKHLQFAEDVRPAYSGTWTRPTQTITGRRPFARDTQVLNYDYDSEAEWEEEADGEEILSDLDDDEAMTEDGEDEEDQAFLDDEEDVQKKRAAGQLVSVVKGPAWEGGLEVFGGMRVQVILEVPEGEGLDPFKDYWTVPKVKEVATNVEVRDGVAPIFAAPSLKPPTVKREASTPAGEGKGLAAFPPAHLPAFLRAIQGSTLSQLLLIETLRQQFMGFKIKKNLITVTLKDVATREGKKEDDKWIVRGDLLEKFGLS
ncbi:hypothetical protein YB2330_001014 [Saitoella coloradoensis]